MPTRLPIVAQEPPRRSTPATAAHASDGRVWRCELHFHRESCGWEAQFFDDDLHGLIAHGGLVTKALAIQRAEEERKLLERRGTE
jgi:hypothetical protein